MSCPARPWICRLNILDWWDSLILFVTACRRPWTSVEPRGSVGLVVAAGALTLTLSVVRLRDFLGLAALHVDDVSACAALAVVLLGALEVLKRAWHGRLNR
jgi:hypothetical protein